MQDDELVFWFMEKHLIKRTMNCSGCKKNKKLCRTKRNFDKYSWRCFKNQCPVKNEYVSIRKNSFLQDLKISLKEFGKLLIFWSNQMILSDILLYVNISRSLLTKIRKKILLKIKEYFENEPLILGGPNRIVQIDETMLNHKVKAHRGRGPKGQSWALGIVDCCFKPAKGLFLEISNKNSATILPLISKYVRPGSIIHTDEAKVYEALGKDKNYEHFSIVHKYKFVDYDKNVHTQHIESYNNKLKLRIKKMKGVKKNDRNSFLLEFVWLDNFFENCFEKTIDLLKVNNE